MGVDCCCCFRDVIHTLKTPESGFNPPYWIGPEFVSVCAFFPCLRRGLRARDQRDLFNRVRHGKCHLGFVLGTPLTQCPPLSCQQKTQALLRWGRKSARFQTFLYRTSNLSLSLFLTQVLPLRAGISRLFILERVTIRANSSS